LISENNFEIFVNGVASAINLTLFKTEPSTAHNHWLIRPIVAFFVKLYLLLPYGNNNITKLTKFMFSHEQPKHPQLYLYSDNDVICPAAHIEEFMQKQKSSGILVESCKFQGSAHVAHSKKYPEQYWSCVVKFLSTISKK